MEREMAIGPEFERVLTAAQAGEEWAFSVLYRELNPRIVRYFAAQVPPEAHDLASETWMGAARALRGFRGDEGAFRGWLFTIARRRLVQHWREASRRPPRAPGVDQAALPEKAAPGDPEAIVLEAESARAAARAIVSSLPADQAEVVLLRVLGGLDVGQVAAILGKRPGTVRVLQHRALRRLAQKFSVETVTR
jgi:RNA polymerase sigma-70 factor, ECF subfamily